MEFCKTGLINVSGYTQSQKGGRRRKKKTWLSIFCYPVQVLYYWFREEMYWASSPEWNQKKPLGSFMR